MVFAYTIIKQNKLTYGFIIITKNLFSNNIKSRDWVIKWIRIPNSSQPKTILLKFKNIIDYTTNATTPIEIFLYFSMIADLCNFFVLLLKFSAYSSFKIASQNYLITEYFIEEAFAWIDSKVCPLSKSLSILSWATFTITCKSSSICSSLSSGFLTSYLSY